MRSKTAPSDTNNNIRKHLSKIREIRSEIEQVPDDYTPHVTGWRTSIDTLQRELETQLSYIISLKATSEDPEKIKELKFRETLYEVIKEIGEEFRSLVQILKPLVHVPKNCEFKN